MVEVKFLVEMVVIIVALAVALYWLFTNYEAISNNFFDFLKGLPLFGSG